LNFRRLIKDPYEKSYGGERTDIGPKIVREKLLASNPPLTALPKTD